MMQKATYEHQKSKSFDIEEEKIYSYCSYRRNQYELKRERQLGAESSFNLTYDDVIKCCHYQRKLQSFHEHNRTIKELIGIL